MKIRKERTMKIRKVKKILRQQYQQIIGNFWENVKSMRTGARILLALRIIFKKIPEEWEKEAPK